MNHNVQKKAAGFLAKTLIASILVMALATGLFYWKGLFDLQRDDPTLGSYFELI